MDARWERLFADLEGQLVEAFEEGEIPDLVEAELVSVRLVDRLALCVGQRLDVTTRSGRRLGGILHEATPGWLALGAGDGLLVIPMVAVATMGPLAGSAPPAATPAATPSFGSLLRTLARAGLPILVEAGTSQVRGHLTAVGADHFDVRNEADAVVSVPFAAVEVVRSRQDAVV